MTIIREPVHKPRPRPAETASATADVYYPRRGIRVDTTFWQHRSIFAGTQEQLNQLRHEADARAAWRARDEFHAFVHTERARSRPSLFEVHRPAFRRLKAIIHVRLIPLLWAITTCRCGDRWPCNDVTQHLRSRVGWTVDITDHLKTVTRRLPKPDTRWSRFRRFLTRRP